MYFSLHDKNLWIFIEISQKTLKKVYIFYIFTYKTGTTAPYCSKKIVQLASRVIRRWLTHEHHWFFSLHDKNLWIFIEISQKTLKKVYIFYIFTYKTGTTAPYCSKKIVQLASRVIRRWLTHEHHWLGIYILIPKESSFYVEFKLSIVFFFAW